MISLYDLLQAGNGQLYGQPVSQIFTGITLSPEPTTRNQLFAALVTPYGDTHRYIEQAIANGATGILCSRVPEVDTSDVTVIIVRDTLNALIAWARHILERYDPQVVLVAGSSGKSTTAHAIRHALATRYPVHNNLHLEMDNRESVPLSLATLMPDQRYTILRCGVNQPGELESVTAIAPPDIAVLTSIHHTHLGNFGSIDAAYADFRQAVAHLPKTSLTVLNYDDERIRSLRDSLGGRALTVSIDNFGTDFMAYNVIVGVQGTGFDLLHAGKRYLGCWSPLLGRHNLYAILSAIAVATESGMRVEDALQAVTTLEPLPGRMRPLVGLNNSLIIDDTHSANTESTLAALDWLAAVKDSRDGVIFIMGEMDAGGDYEQQAKRLVGQSAAKAASVLITQGAGAAPIGRAAFDWGMRAENVQSAYSAVGTLNALFGRSGLTSNDVVLVKGSSQTEMKPVIEGLIKQVENTPTSPTATHAAIRKTSTLRRPGIGRPSWLEIDAGAIANNTRLLKQMIGSGVTLMAIVKADGYGHGAVLAAQTALANGADYIGVANLQEALDLRTAGVNAPIFVMSYTPFDAVRLAIQNSLTLSLYDPQQAAAFDRAARDAGQKLRVHVKVDTGFGRLGLRPEETLHLFRQLRGMPFIEVEGIYTHFSSADSDPVHTAKQTDALRQIVRPLRATGYEFRYVHAANSAGTLASPDNHFNMVRPGLALYGLTPSPDVPLPIGFQPAMTWKTVVAQVRTLPAGHPVGYGNTYVTTQPERIAVLPIGYADGFRRAPHFGEVLIHGQRAPILGRVSMEKTVVSVEHISGVGIGDEVVILGKQDGTSITAEDIAERVGSINYEIVTNALPRIPRR
jgi:alanine racemase